MKKVLIFLTVIFLTLSMFGCKQRNVEIENGNVDGITDTENNVSVGTYDEIGLNVNHLTEKYVVEILNHSDMANHTGYFNKDDIDGEIVFDTSYGSVMHDSGEYSYRYDLTPNLPMNTTIRIAPENALGKCNLWVPDTIWGARYFAMYYPDGTVCIESNRFEALEFIDENNAKIINNDGDFAFTHYLDFFNCEDDDFYIVSIYGINAECANIEFVYDSENCVYTISSTTNISNIYVEVTSGENDTYETYLSNDIQGKIIKIKINDKFEPVVIN